MKNMDDLVRTVLNKENNADFYRERRASVILILSKLIGSRITRHTYTQVSDRNINSCKFSMVASDTDIYGNLIIKRESFF